MKRRLLAWAVGALLLATRPGAAQEFAAPAPNGALGHAAFLERGLPPPQSAASATALAIRWHGLAELQTRSLAAGIGWRSARVAVGLSQTGETDVGWSALAVAAGATSEQGGFGLRACVRQRVATIPQPIGGEIGAGAWLEAMPQVTAWACAPQLWTRGDAPPLARWLQIGARIELADARLWLAREAAPGAPNGLRAEHVLGISVPCGPAGVWIEARDHPARGTLGLGARAGALCASATVEGHPVLSETVRLALGWNERPWW